MACGMDLFFPVAQGSTISQSDHVKTLMTITLSVPVTSLGHKEKLKCGRLYFVVSWLLYNFIRP